MAPIIDEIIIDELTVHSDDRGIVFEPIAENSLEQQHNAHVVVSQPGAVRGNHYHIYGTETISVKGPALLRIREENDTRDIEIPNARIFRFIIPPKVSHAIKNTDSQPNILVAFNTQTHDPKNPDVVRDVLLEEK
jgi:UDP-2-acetamido-2,6-beta-L-arabino-hexul-4-ose reductase